MPELSKRMLNYARTLTTRKHQNHVAKELQRMVRAEAAAKHGNSLAIYKGQPEFIFTCVGECVCVTCGDIHWWTGSQRMQGGHMLPGRNRYIVLDEELVYPQCNVCNQHRSGAMAEFRLFAETLHGVEWYEAKVLQSNGYRNVNGRREQITPHTLEERVALHMEFKRRTREAERIINGCIL